MFQVLRGKNHILSINATSKQHAHWQKCYFTSTMISIRVLLLQFSLLLFPCCLKFVSSFSHKTPRLTPFYKQAFISRNPIKSHLHQQFQRISRRIFILKPLIISTTDPKVTRLSNKNMWCIPSIGVVRIQAILSLHILVPKPQLMMIWEALKRLLSWLFLFI